MHIYEYSTRRILLRLKISTIFAPILGAIALFIVCIVDLESWWIGLIILGATAIVSLICGLIHRALKHEAQYRGMVPTDAEMEARKRQREIDEKQAKQEREKNYYDN